MSSKSAWNDFIQSFQSSWKKISSHHFLEEAFLQRFQNDLDWSEISRHQRLSESFIVVFQDRIDWDGISCNGHAQFSESFYVQFEERLNFYGISMSHKLQENVLERFLYKLDWDEIWRCQKVSMHFLEKYHKGFCTKNWSDISKKQVLSPDFILRHEKLVDWSKISQYQDLTDDLIVSRSSLIVKYCLKLNVHVFKRRLAELLAWDVGTVSEIKRSHFCLDVCKEILSFLIFRSGHSSMLSIGPDMLPSNRLCFSPGFLSDWIQVW